MNNNHSEYFNKIHDILKTINMNYLQYINNSDVAYSTDVASLTQSQNNYIKNKNTNFTSINDINCNLSVSDNFMLFSQNITPQDLEVLFKLLVSLLDLTSLSNQDNHDSICSLYKNANNKFGTVASICVYAQFISLVDQLMSSDAKHIPIATVVNFPNGDSLLDDILKEVDYALGSGAEEIDFVFPYQQLLQQNDIKYCESIVKAIYQLCDKHSLSNRKKNKIIIKSIIESGELKEQKFIELATKISADNGCDFIKTSTGKTPVGATFAAVDTMLSIIKNYPNLGIKISGGVKNIIQAIGYLLLILEHLGAGFINRNYVRIGASSLLFAILKN